MVLKKPPKGGFFFFKLQSIFRMNIIGMVLTEVKDVYRIYG